MDPNDHDHGHESTPALTIPKSDLSSKKLIFRPALHFVLMDVRFPYQRNSTESLLYSSHHHDPR